MVKWIGVLLLIGFVLLLFGVKFISSILFALSGATFLLLLIPLAIEAHQDRVLNEIAAHEEKEES